MIVVEQKRLLSDVYITTFFGLKKLQFAYVFE